MGQTRRKCRAIAGGLVGVTLGSTASLLMDRAGAEMDVRILGASIGALAWLGAFVGAFGFPRGSQVWNDTLDTIDEMFPT